MAFGLALLVVFAAVITTSAIVDGFVPPSRVQSIDPTKVAQTPPFDHPGLRKVADRAYEAYYVARVFSFAPAATCSRWRTSTPRRSCSASGRCSGCSRPSRART